jgi:hypothetical protein
MKNSEVIMLMSIVFISTVFAPMEDKNEAKVKLQQAEKISALLFEAVEKNNLIVPGKSVHPTWYCRRMIFFSSIME